MDAIVVLAPTNYPKRNTRRSSTKLPKPSPASELQQFFDFPDVIGNACFHCRRDAKRFMHAAKVIGHEVQSDHVSVVFQLLAESVREPVDWSRQDLSQYAGIARQNGGDVRQESGPVNALFTDKQVAYFSSVAWGPAGGRGKAERNLCSATPFLHPERERQATEVGRYGSGVLLEHRSVAWSQVPCAEQWLTVGATQLIPFGRVSSMAQLGRCLQLRKRATSEKDTER
jgi:hypothetical protein